MFNKMIFRPLLLFFLFLSALGFVPKTEKMILYDGKTGAGYWYSCDKKKTQLYEKDKKLIAYINQSHFECFGLYFDSKDFSRHSLVHFQAGMETKYAEDTLSLYVSLIDEKKNTTAFKKVMFRMLKGSTQTYKVNLEELFLQDKRVDFTHINSVLFYVGSRRDSGFWGNVVVKDIWVE